jgi:hypothetical protein
MGYDQLQGATPAPSLTAMLLHPTTLFLLGANAVPIFGVLYWGWDAFVLLMLYWMETAIIGFWTILRIAVSPPGTLGPLLVNGRPVTNSSLAMAGFFVVHAGAFMGGHLLFLWIAFAGAWARKIHGPIDFYHQIVVATGFWLPLLALFISRGVSFLFHVLKPDMIRRLERLLPFRMPQSERTADDAATIIIGFYGRMTIMHMAIIFGAFIAVFVGSIAPLLILVTLKTVVDVGLHLAMDFRYPLKNFPGAPHAPSVATS